jgi:hypothetical protein
MRTYGSPPNRASSSGPRNSAPAARSCKVAWPGRCSARSPPGSGAVRSSTAGGSSRTSGPVDVLAKQHRFPGDVPLALPSPHRRRPNRFATGYDEDTRGRATSSWRKRHYPKGPCTPGRSHKAQSLVSCLPVEHLGTQQPLDIEWGGGAEQWLGQGQGISALIRVPRVCGLSTSRWPSSASTRSASPRSPVPCAGSAPPTPSSQTVTVAC